MSMLQAEIEVYKYLDKWAELLVEKKLFELR